MTTDNLPPLPELPDRDVGFDRNASLSEDRLIGEYHSAQTILEWGERIQREAFEAGQRSMQGQIPNNVLQALDLEPTQYRDAYGDLNVTKLRETILRPSDYLPPEHFLRRAHHPEPSEMMSAAIIGFFTLNDVIKRLRHALTLVMHATNPSLRDGGAHENAYEIARAALGDHHD